MTLVPEGTNDRNTLQQAGIFKEALGVTGIALTRLDGTARGGIIVAVAREIPVPIKSVGIGEVIVKYIYIFSIKDN